MGSKLPVNDLSSTRLSWGRRATLWVCLVFLVTVSSAEAAHICGFKKSLNSSHSAISIDRAGPSDNGICLICIGSQPATHSAVAAHWVPDFSVREILPVESFVPVFGGSATALYSRPPPSV
ncbi:MAG TPA: hypothetical protein VFQ00_03610 [Terriglobales bacterium]|nr:hypothetical protein [Terriglobales bacterium]